MRPELTVGAKDLLQFCTSTNQTVTFPPVVELIEEAANRDHTAKHTERDQMDRQPPLKK